MDEKSSQFTKELYRLTKVLVELNVTLIERIESQDILIQTLLEIRGEPLFKDEDKNV